MENDLFLVGHFEFLFYFILFYSILFYFIFFLLKTTLDFIWGINFFEILMITLVFSQKLLPPNILAASVSRETATFNAL